MTASISTRAVLGPGAMMAQDQEEALRDRPELEAARQIAGERPCPFMRRVAVEVHMQLRAGQSRAPGGARPFRRSDCPCRIPHRCRGRCSARRDACGADYARRGGRAGRSRPGSRRGYRRCWPPDLASSRRTARKRADGRRGLVGMLAARSREWPGAMPGR